MKWLVCAAALCARGGSALTAPPPAPTPDLPITFSAGFSDNSVLQRHDTLGAKVYGFAPTAGEVTVTVTGPQTYTVQAVVTPWDNSGFHPATPAEPLHGQFVWVATLKPTPAASGAQYTIEASDGVANHTTTIRNVVYGDVFFCSGQSNMALSIYYTFSSDLLKKEVQSGKYTQVRHFMFGSMSAHYEATTPQWTTAYNSVTPSDSTSFVWHTLAKSTAIPSRNQSNNQLSPYAQFSATCLYFGVELADKRAELGKDTEVPIGLIQSAIGGSQIESWMDNTTLTECTNESLSGGAIPQDSGALYYGMVAPFQNYSVAGWLWYQGENNVYGDPGNSLRKEGYGCELPAMVKSWRAGWWASDTALFGVATLAAGGSEGNGHHMAGIRWSETTNFGVLPSPALPLSFLAQVYDLPDPWASMGDQPGAGDPNHCTLPPYGPNCSAWDPAEWSPGVQAYAPQIRLNSPSGVPGSNFMGGIHPRLKRPVGARLASAAVAQMYPTLGLAVSGPTISGCQLGSDTLTLRFNSTLLGKDTIMVQKFETNMSKWSGVDSSGLMVCAAVPSGGGTNVSCDKKCAESGHCCLGLESCNQQPSCSQGCALAGATSSLEECQAVCRKMPAHCTYTQGNLSLGMCAGCCSWTPSNPAPPGYSPYSTCSPMSPDECEDGCAYAHGAPAKPLFPEVNATTCGCQTWASVPCDGGVEGGVDQWPCDGVLQSGEFWYCEDGPGWKPPMKLRKRGRELARQRSLAIQRGLEVPQAPQNPYEAIWTAAAVVAVKGSDNSVAVDLSGLAPNARVLSVRYGWPLGDQGDTCCPEATVTGATQERVAPCVPASCPLLTKTAQLPANPFFATVVEGTGKCSCEAPQVCNA